MLASIAVNPNTPAELVEKIADSTQLPGGAVNAAKRELERRTAQ